MDFDYNVFINKIFSAGFFAPGQAPADCSWRHAVSECSPRVVSVTFNVV